MRGHDQRFTDRAGDLVDRGRTGDADVDQRAVDADHGAEQTDERRGRADGGEERQAAEASFELIAASERASEPCSQSCASSAVGHLAVLFGGEGIVDELAPGAVLVELGSAFAELPARQKLATAQPGTAS
jgi:hypothetical protein